MWNEREYYFFYLPNKRSLHIYQHLRIKRYHNIIRENKN
jgi:hypothetical protein